MKQDLIKDVVQGMLPYLNNAQNEKLQEVLQYTLANYVLTEKHQQEKNLAVELLKKLIAEQVSVYRRTNIVKSEKFSDIMQRTINAYLNGMLTNEEVIEEMLKLAKQLQQHIKKETN